MSYFQKGYLHAVTVLDYLPELIRGLGLADGVHFLYSFFIKIFFI